MFSNALIGLLLGIGLGTWVYAKLVRSTGGNTKSSLIGASLAGGITFLAIWLLLGMIIKPS